MWLAHDELLGRPVAIKILAPGLTDDRAWLARFRREARIAAQLQHPNLVSIYDFDADSERPYLVMSYMRGGSLQQRIDHGGVPDAERLATDLLRALDHVHSAGVTHRDVKPGNVLFEQDGRACLSDFGIARPQDATSITQTGQIPGTARYMAPELWRGDPASAASDLFACGVVLSECIGEGAPPPVAHLAEQLSAERRELRPASAVDALAMLEKPAGLPSLPPTESMTGTEPIRMTERRVGRGFRNRIDTRRWLPIAALCLFALISGFVLASSVGDDDSDPPEQRTADAGEGSGESEASATPDGGGEAQAQEPPAPELGQPPATDPVALNDQGFALIQQGRYDEAIPILQQAVDGLEGSGDITYAYALFNLGNALRLAGRPAEAIPILERRLEIPNQTEVVKGELKQAEEDLKAQEKGED